MSDKKGKEKPKTFDELMHTSSTDNLMKSFSTVGQQQPAINESLSQMVTFSNSNIPEYNPSEDTDTTIDFYIKPKDRLPLEGKTAKGGFNFGPKAKKVGVAATYSASYISVGLEIFFNKFLLDQATIAGDHILDAMLGPENSAFAKQVAHVIIFATTAVNYLLDIEAVRPEQEAYDVLHESPAPPKKNHQQKERLKRFNLAVCIFAWAALAQADVDGMASMFKMESDEEKAVIIGALAVFGPVYYYMFSKGQVIAHADEIMAYIKKENLLKKTLPVGLVAKVSLFIEKYKTPLIVMCARGIATGAIMNDLMINVMKVSKDNIGQQIATMVFTLIGTYAAGVTRSLRAMAPYHNDKWAEITPEEYQDFKEKSTYVESAQRMITWGTLTDTIQDTCLGWLFWHNLDNSLPVLARIAASGILPAAFLSSSLYTSLVTGTLNQIVKEKEKAEDTKKKSAESEKPGGTVAAPDKEKVRENDRLSPEENKYEKSSLDAKETKSDDKSKSLPKAKDERSRISFAAHPDDWKADSLKDFLPEIKKYTKAMNTRFEQVSWVSRTEVTDAKMIPGLQEKAIESNLLIVATNLPEVIAECKRLQGLPSTIANIKIVPPDLDDKYDWSQEGKHRQIVKDEIRQFISQDLFQKIGKILYDSGDGWFSAATLLKIANLIAGFPRLLSNWSYADTFSTVLASISSMDALNPDDTTKTLLMLSLLLQMVRGDRAVYKGEVEASARHFMAKFKIGAIEDKKRGIDDGSDTGIFASMRKTVKAIFAAQQEYDPAKLIRVLEDELRRRKVAAEQKQSTGSGVTNFFSSVKNPFKKTVEGEEPLLGDNKERKATNGTADENPEVDGDTEKGVNKGLNSTGSKSSTTTKNTKDGKGKNTNDDDNTAEDDDATFNHEKSSEGGSRPEPEQTGGWGCTVS